MRKDYNSLKEEMLKSLRGQFDFIKEEIEDSKRQRLQQLRWVVDDMAYMFYFKFDDMKARIEFNHLVVEIQRYSEEL